MNLAHGSVTRPVAVTMRIAALVLLGAVCFTKLPVDLLPNISVPTISVITQWPNVAPEEMETQVTRPIEQAVSAAPNVYMVQSNSSMGVSTVRVSFQWGTDLGQAAVDVLQDVEKARSNLPVDPTLQAPIVYKFDPSQMPIMTYAVSGESDPVKLRTILDNEIAPVVESANGVASVSATGGGVRSILVDADPAKLRAYNVSLSQLSNRISQENQSSPGGIGKQGQSEFTIRSIGWFTSMADIARVPLSSTNGHTITVGNVAHVSDSQQEQRLFTRLNGSPAAGLIISKQSAANTIDTADAVKAKIAQIEQRYPNLHFSIVYDQSQFVQNSVDDLKMNAIVGGVLAILILLFFLRNVRSTLVVALSIPISIISTFTLLYICGFTLNTMSLGGLALATGLIADDAVVVLENIYRHYERDNVSPTDAAIHGANEIFSAVTASTITIVVVFLPLLLLKGQTGQMFLQFALVVIFSIAVSLLDATTVVPMLASRVIRPEHEETHPGVVQRMFDRWGVWFDNLDNSYRNGLTWAIRHRVLVVVLAVAATAASFLLKPFIGSEALPPTDSGNLQVNLRLTPGTAVTTTNTIVKQIEQTVLADPDVATVFSAAGSGLNLSGTSVALNGNQGSLQVRLKDNRKRSTLQIVTDLQQKLGNIPGARLRVASIDVVSQILSGGGTGFDVDIFGPDLNKLTELGAQMVTTLNGIPGLANVSLSIQDPDPEMQWKIDRAKAIEHGVSFQDVANTIMFATNGTTSSYYQDSGYQYPIIVEVPPALRRTSSQMKELPIFPSTSTPSTSPIGPHPIMLQQVATSSQNTGPSEIIRLGRQRYMVVQGDAQGRSVGQLQADVQKRLAGFKLPSGYYWDWGYPQKQQADQFSGMGVAILLAIGLIYMLLAAQFESFVHPLTILCSVPVSATGVLLALFLTGRSFGVTALIGMLMLVGIVVKNGILLVDYTNLLRKSGMDRDEAILKAGPTRLRPILMTSSAAILGMVPIALAIGKGSETNAPMATVVIGGLLTSTFLTLFIVPVVYTFFDDLGSKLRRGEKPTG